MATEKTSDLTRRGVLRGATVSGVSASAASVPNQISVSGPKSAPYSKIWLLVAAPPVAGSSIRSNASPEPRCIPWPGWSINR